MAKKDSSKKKNGKKDKASAGAVEAVEAVRSAVERTFAATSEGAQSLRGPAQELAGELAAAANRFREVLEDRVLRELKGLRSDVEGLGKRVSALEGRARGTAASTTPAARPAASRSAAKKPATRRTAARKSAASSKRSSTAKPASSSARRSPAAKKPASGGGSSSGS
jgi:hypothetical protein